MSAQTFPPLPSTPPARARILVVDDDEDLVDNLAAVLRSREHLEGTRNTRFSLDIVTARNAADALLLAAGGFDLALVDVKLPDGSGIDLIRPLKERTPHGEVVLVTGTATVKAALGALSSGAFAFVLKSFRPEELLAVVDQVLTKVELQRSRALLERRYRDLVELTDVLVVGLDPSGRVALWNRKAAHATGVSQVDAVGRVFAQEWIGERDRRRLEEAIERIRERAKETGLGTEGGAREIETTLEVPGAPARRIRWHLSQADEDSNAERRLAPADGNARIVYAIGVDVTERQALEKRAADAEALSAMGRLAMNLAHEIRNPLNAAVLQLHLLGRQVEKLDSPTDTKEGFRSRIRIVGDEIGRLNRLLTEFLELARPRSILREPVHVSRLVEDVLDLEAETARARNVTIVRDVAAEGVVAIGDREKLKQVVLNVVVNALEAMKDGGRLTARVTGDGDRVTFVLEDDGPGILDEHRATVFDPFFTTKEAGTGLGLSIVRKIVDQHAGTITLESLPVRGTRVVVTIPDGRAPTARGSSGLLPEG